MQELTFILEIISQCDVKHILRSTIKTTMQILNVWTNTSTSITARLIGHAHAVILVNLQNSRCSINVYVCSYIIIRLVIYCHLVVSVLTLKFLGLSYSQIDFVQVFICILFRTELKFTTIKWI